MIDELPYGTENVKKVKHIIKENNLDAEIVPHPHQAVTSLQIHLDLYGGISDQVLKCLCLVSKGRPLVVMASGEVKIDMNKLSKVSHMKEIRMARKEELESLFGRIPGAVDPLTIPKDVPIFADKKLFEKEWVVGSSGSPYAGLKIKPKEILKVKKLIIDNFAQG